MKEFLADCLWTQEQLGEALVPLAHAAGVRLVNASSIESMKSVENTSNLDGWLDTNLSKQDLEAEQIHISYGEAERVLKEAAPAILEYNNLQHGYLVLLQRHWSRIVLLKPDGSNYKVTPRKLAVMLRYELRESHRSEFDSLLEFAGMNPAEQARALDALLKVRLKNEYSGKLWQLRMNPGSDFWGQVRRVAAVPLLVGAVVSHAATYGLLLLFWSVLGMGVFSGRVESQTLWFLAGLLLLLALLRPISPWLFGILSIRVGERLKQRLLYGALRLEPDEIRHQGLGQFLGRVIETEAIETSAMRGSVNIFMGLIQLTVTVPYLVFGVGGWWHVALLGAWLGVSLVMGWRYLGARALWTRTRLNLTNDLVEQLVGYRTRLAQQPRTEWHIQEEQLLADYDRFSGVMDRCNAWLKAALPYGWTLVGLFALLPFLRSSSVEVAEIAVTVSGVVFASLSFQQIAEGLTQFSDAWVAWDQVKLLFDAAGRPLRSAKASPSSAMQANASEVMLVAENLRFRYTTRTEEVLSECNFSINEGDRVLLLGASGSGKSTLAAVLSGLRAPQGGSLRLGGKTEKEIDGDLWRKRIVSVPQFHENHIFTESFAFNLLMGRRWPPTREDLQEAQQICAALGLDTLLQEMPGGLFQFVGETGWQLSHGEKSRVYIARALLQGADLIILDESFSALDAESLRQSLECVVQNAPSLVVVAHP